MDLVEHEADGDRGWARWIAKYTFTQTGRPVTNDVRAKMRFRDGLIAEHWDSFSLHSWTRQALGDPRAACWAGARCVQKPVRRRARGASTSSWTLSPESG